ncbi:MAG: hypothetical protein A2Y88_00975 [Chloroflexi bacterium RBG_13_48_10]|nr:MAG: hypothetical protein A2Y88_00975 [Chloroflexi bacterium RBG_13_48_10]
MKGLLLKESLADTKVLDLLQVTSSESWQINNAAPYQPTVWTALSFEADANESDAIADKLSQALKAQGWYINASTETHVYVIFPNKVFKYLKGDGIARGEASRYALSIGIPKDQLDWDE